MTLLSHRLPETLQWMYRTRYCRSIFRLLNIITIRNFGSASASDKFNIGSITSSTTATEDTVPKIISDGDLLPDHNLNLLRKLSTLKRDKKYIEAIILWQSLSVSQSQSLSYSQGLDALQKEHHLYSNPKVRHMMLSIIGKAYQEVVSSSSKTVSHHKW